MSTPPDDLVDEPSEPNDRRRLILRVLALVSALISLVALWSGERVRIRDDLQLVVPTHVRPGDPLPLHAFVLRDVEAPAGPSLARVPVTVRLLDGAERELAKTTLEPTALDAMDGQLMVPSSAQGALTVSATALETSDVPLRCRRVIDVRPTAPASPLSGRTAGPLQQFAVGELKPVGMATAPTPFAPRTLGGACVPEQRCVLLVWVGEPGASVHAEPNPAITLLGDPLPRDETSGLVEIALRVHGLEAELTLVAERGGETVARRALRLPVGLGDVAVHTERSVLDEGDPLKLSLALPPGRSHAIVDLFHEGHLVATRTLADVVADAPLALELPRAPGLWRVQARVDRFSAEGAGARLVYVRRRGEALGQILPTLARSVLPVPGHDAVADSWASAPPAWAERDLDRAAAFALAPLEALRAQLPETVSGRPAQLARLDRARRYVRFSVSALLVVCALFVGASLARRGLAADQEASAILAEADQAAEAEPDGPHRPGTMWVLSLTLAVVLAFLAGALLIASKSLWF